MQYYGAGAVCRLGEPPHTTIHAAENNRQYGHNQPNQNGQTTNPDIPLRRQEFTRYPQAPGSALRAQVIDCVTHAFNHLCTGAGYCRALRRPSRGRRRTGRRPGHRFPAQLHGLDRTVAWRGLAGCGAGAHQYCISLRTVTPRLDSGGACTDRYRPAVT